MTIADPFPAPTPRMHQLAMERVKKLIEADKIHRPNYIQNAMADAIHDYVREQVTPVAVSNEAVDRALQTWQGSWDHRYMARGQMRLVLEQFLAGTAT